MQEKSLQTTTKQRIVIIVIAVLLLISTLGVYMLIVLNGGAGSSSSVEAITERYNSKYEEYLTANAGVSDKYFNEFSKYRSDVKAYNEASATNGVLDKKDLKKGDGRELGEGDSDYAAYYMAGVLMARCLILRLIVAVKLMVILLMQMRSFRRCLALRWLRV